MRSRQTRHPLIAFRLLSLTLVAVCGVVVGSAGAAALSPNESIFLYSPGKARTGVLTDSKFVRKDSFSITGVTHAAASRSSLALYNKATGKLRTGTFRGGVYTPVETISIRSGFTHMAASCDSLLFYNQVSGRILTGTLIGGRFRNRTDGLRPSGWQEVAASCDTAWFVRPGDGGSVHELGVLEGGDYTKIQDATDGPRVLTAMTDTSWLALSGEGLGDWGPVADGSRTFLLDYSYNFYAWEMLAGTARHVLFYTSSGFSCIWRLVGNVETQVTECGQIVPPGFTVLAGGR